MMTTKKYYKVPKVFNNGYIYYECGVWCSDKLKMKDIRNMNFYNDVSVQCQQINSKLIDDSLKECTFFTFIEDYYKYNDIQTGYIMITWDELMEACETVEIIVCE